MECCIASLASHKKEELPTLVPVQWQHAWDGPQAAHLNVSPGRDAANQPSETTPAFVPGPAGHMTFMKSTTWFHQHLFWHYAFVRK